MRAPLIIRTEDLSVALLRMSYTQKLRLPRWRYYLCNSPSSNLIVVPFFLSLFFLFFLCPSPASLSSGCVHISRGGLPCFCFDNIFSHCIGNESSSSFSSLSSQLLLPLPAAFDLVHSAVDSSRDLSLLGNSWIIINAYAVAGGIGRPVFLSFFFFLFYSLPSFFFLFFCSPSLPSLVSDMSV